VILSNCLVGDGKLGKGDWTLRVRNDIDSPIAIIDKVIGDAPRGAGGIVVTCPRRPDRQLHPVATHYCDYEPVQGLMIPHIYETAVATVKQTGMIKIKRIVLNPERDGSLFKKPE
jgi:hypothetical protein